MAAERSGRKSAMLVLKDSREACQEVKCAEWVWRTDDGMTTLRCGAGHAGPRPFMTIRSPALHPIKRCVIKAFGFATNQHYFGAAGESLLRGKSEGSLSGWPTVLLAAKTYGSVFRDTSRRRVAQIVKSNIDRMSGYLLRYCPHDGQTQSTEAAVELSSELR
jgi:hypothetical protein